MSPQIAATAPPPPPLGHTDGGAVRRGAAGAGAGGSEKERGSSGWERLRGPLTPTWGPPTSSGGPGPAAHPLHEDRPCACWSPHPNKGYHRHCHPPPPPRPGTSGWDRGIAVEAACVPSTSKKVPGTNPPTKRLHAPHQGRPGFRFRGGGGGDRALRPDPPSPPKRAQLTGPPKSYRV